MFENTQEKVSETLAPVTRFGRNVAFAGLGTFGLMGDSFKAVVEKGGEYSHKLVERGEEVAGVTRQRVGDVVEEPQSLAKGSVDRVNDAVGRVSEQVLIRFNLPTSSEIDALNRKVGSLDRKLNKAIKETKPKTRSRTKKATPVAK